MNRDGTPETDLERAAVESGAAKLLTLIGAYAPETKEQTDRILNIGVNPLHDPHARAMHDALSDITEQSVIDDE